MGILSDPVGSSFDITPDDDTDLPHETRALYVGGAGHVTAIMRNGVTQLYSNMPVGWHPIRITRVLDTGTTATLLVGTH